MSLKITKRNALYQQLQALKHNRTKRLQRGEFIATSVRSINLAFKHDWEVSYLIINSQKNLSGWAQGVVARLRGSVEQIHLSDELLKELSDKEDGNEILLVLKFKHSNQGNSAFQGDFRIIVFDRPQYPGNLGTIIRSADAFGFNLVITVGHAVDIYDPEVVRSSTGSFFSVPVISYANHPEFINYIQTLQKRYPELKILGTDENGDQDIREYQADGPVCLIMGNEGKGMSESLRAICDTTLSISIRGEASSLNVANAASIFMYELSGTKQR